MLVLAPVVVMAALPLSRSTTYVAGSPPPIKAQDLNDLQDYMGTLYSGTRSVKSLVADGTGGASVAPQTGTVVATRTTAQTAVPTNASMLPGEVNKESVPVGMGHLSTNGTVYGAANIVAFSNVSTGICTVTFGFVPPGNDANRALIQVTAQNNLNYTCRPTALIVDGSNRLKVTVGCQDSGGGAQDSGFYVSAYSL